MALTETVRFLRMADEKNPVRWTHTIQSGDWNVVKYGMVEYLRKHPKMRAVTAILGLAWILGWLLSLGGFKWHFTIMPAFAAWFVSPVLLWMAVVSGPDHSLTFAPPKAPDPPATPALPAETGSLLNPEDFGMNGLNTTCTVARNQAKGAYKAFLAFLLTGISVGMANLIFLGTHVSFVYYGHAWLYVWATAAAFVLLSLIQLVRSVLLERRTSRLEDKLIVLQGTVTALKFIERNPSSTTAAIDAATVIRKLLAPEEQTNS